MISLVYLAILTTLINVASSVPSPIIETSIGAIEGKEESGVFKFLGVPFAEQPTGERRFAKPAQKKTHVREIQRIKFPF